MNLNPFNRGNKPTKVLTKISRWCTYCKNDAALDMMWPDGDVESVCNEHAKFIAQGLTELTLITSTTEAA